MKILIAACLILAIGPGITCSREKTRPNDADEERESINVLLVSFDCLRADHAGCNGYPFETTPHLDRIADAGTNFTRAYAQSSWTGASHMSMMTSLYPPVHGVNTAPIPEPLSEDITTLAEILKEAGYRTAGFAAGTYLKSVFGFHRGFEVYDEAFGRQRTCPEVNEKALAWLEDLVGEKAPFFLFVHYFDPHFPYDPPSPYDTMFDPDYSGASSIPREQLLALLKESGGKAEQADREELEHIIALYDGEIRYADNCFGEILGFIEKRGELGRTLVIATSDHGEAFLDHTGECFHGRSLYGELLNVPLVVKFPEPASPRATCSEIVRLIDIAPTILDVIGIPVPDYMQGRSILSLMTQNGAAVGQETEHKSYAELRRKDKKGAEKRVLESITVRQWKLIRNALEREAELYNLHLDPKEQNDLAREQPDIVSLLERELEDISKGNMSRTGERPQEEPHQYSREITEELKALGYLQ